MLPFGINELPHFQAEDPLDPWLSTPPQGDLSWRRVPHAPLPLRSGPSGWSHHLAPPVHHLQGGIHRAAALRLALSPDAPGDGAPSPVSDARWTEFGAVRRD